MSVADAIEYALKHAPTKISVDINHACEAYLDSKREGNSKVRYLAGLKSQFSQIQADFGKRTVDSISKDELQKFIRDLTAKDGDTPAAPKTRINFIITLKALFNFAVSEGWRGENPAAQIPRPKLDEVTIEILTPQDVATLLQTAEQAKYSDVFPALLIQLFAGPRRSEIPHLTWDSIKDNYLRLEKTKVKKKRAVGLHPTLHTWLAPYSKPSGRILELDGVSFDSTDTRNMEDAYTYRLAQISVEAEIALPKNVLRHTAITYRHALTGDLHETANWAGNSPRVIEQHYRGAATKADAVSFYALTPSTDSKVVSITASQ